MTGDDVQLQRLRFLARIVQREREHLLTTDRRVFAEPFTQDRAKALAAAIDNLDRAERLGWLTSADQWPAVRRLRDQMVHEYIEDPAILASALQAAHEQVPMLIETSKALLDELNRRGWSSP